MKGRHPVPSRRTIIIGALTLLVSTGGAAFVLLGTSTATTDRPSIDAWLGDLQPTSAIADLTRTRLQAQARADGSSLDGDHFALGDDATVGSTVLAPTNGRRGACFVTTLPKHAGAYGGCMPELPRRGASTNVTDNSQLPGIIVDGIASADVERIVVTTRDGATHSVVPMHGRYLWAAADRERGTPAVVTIVRPSGSVEVDLSDATRPVVRPDDLEAQHG